MEGKVTDMSMLHSRKVIQAQPATKGRKVKDRENKLIKMDSAEFLWMSAGSVIVGTGIYLLTFLIV